MDDVLKGKWKQLKGEIKQRWGDLTDDELTQAEGSRDKLIGLIQERYGYTKQKAEEEVNTFLREKETRRR